MLCFEDRIAVLNIYFLYWREYMHARTPFPYIITVHVPLIANLIIYNRVLVPNNKSFKFMNLLATTCRFYCVCTVCVGLVYSARSDLNKNPAHLKVHRQSHPQGRADSPFFPTCPYRS